MLKKIAILTWSTHGPGPFVSGVIGNSSNMDKTIGKDVEIVIDGGMNR